MLTVETNTASVAGYLLNYNSCSFSMIERQQEM